VKRPCEVCQSRPRSKDATYVDCCAACNRALVAEVRPTIIATVAQRARAAERRRVRAAVARVLDGMGFRMGKHDLPVKTGVLRAIRAKRSSP
jgi:hypothetical protein